jgi:hypothetical protein
MLGFLRSTQPTAMSELTGVPKEDIVLPFYDPKIWSTFLLLFL